jgi:hypothetical protein
VQLNGVEITAWSWTIAVGVFVVGVAAVIWWVNHADAQA